jgi:hypothetical protein
MSWDIAISPAGDLIFTPGDVVFSASADLSGISGVDLIEQRMLVRLKLQRGSWVYDEDGSFGSQLYKLASMTPQTAMVQADAYVREALRDISEIQIDEVAVSMNGSALILIISYQVTDETISPSDENEQQLEVVIQEGSA